MGKTRQGFPVQEIHGKDKLDDGAGRALVMKMTGERVMTAMFEYICMAAVRLALEPLYLPR
jgi:hypothetical protein